MMLTPLKFLNNLRHRAGVVIHISACNMGQKTKSYCMEKENGMLNLITANTPVSFELTERHNYFSH
jgi:hypothetical protein